VSLDYDMALREVEARLGESAVAHCKGVAETARLLAVVYGVDVEMARLAGLLHDWDRESGAEALIAAANDCGLEIDDSELGVPYLLHAHTGAAQLAQLFPLLPSEVLSAVERHTVGHARMTDLDKVVYLADMIEPGRDFDGVDDLRECVGTVALDDLFAAAYARSVEYLIRSRKWIHPRTVEVWNAFVARDQK
jgi:predicted HD superfamily hydrolase involved in NAD metabolism